MIGAEAEYYKQVPTDPVANLKYRAELLDRCRSPLFRAGVIDACRRDICFYVSSFVWYHNPLTKIKVGPLILWPFQIDCIHKTLDRWVDKGRDFLWEKSREMGATWMALIIIDWLCLFHEWEQCMAVSHSLIAVDNGKADTNTLFWKIRHMHDHLPRFMTRGVLDSGNKKSPVIEYPKTHGSLAGYASTGRSGVGGRGKVMLDELGKQDRAHEIVGNTADVGPRLFISTHYGIGTEFYNLCQRADLPKVVMHWTQHPEKNKGLYRFNEEEERVEFLNERFERVDKSDYSYPSDYVFVTDGTPTGGPYPGVRSVWYDAECVRRQDKRQVAMHLDIDAQGSDMQFFDATILRQLKLSFCCHPIWEGDLTYDKQTGHPIELVERTGGPLKLWRTPAHDGKFKMGRYGAGADIATGSGATATCLTVIDANTCEKVLEYANPHIGNEKFAPLAAAICRLFPGIDSEGALIAWEQHGPGILFGKRIIEIGYREIYYRQSELPHTRSVKFSDTPGWHAGPDEILLLLEEYRAALQNRRLINRSRESIDECAKFRYNPQGKVEHSQQVTTTDPSGARENHGDRTVADALAWKMCQQLGLGKPGKPVVESGVAVGSFGWRRELRAQRQREDEEAA